MITSDLRPPQLPTACAGEAPHTVPTLYRDDLGAVETYAVGAPFEAWRQRRSADPVVRDYSARPDQRF